MFELKFWLLDIDIAEAITLCIAKILTVSFTNILDENEIIGKGPNGTLRAIFNGIQKLNKGEKHLKITCDDAGGQNKNNTTI